MGFSLASMLAVACLAFLAGLLFRLKRVTLIAVVLTTLFINGGNYGLPLVSFAFGQEALAYASINFVATNLWMCSLPTPLQRAVPLAAGAVIPGMLILLGLELTRVE